MQIDGHHTLTYIVARLAGYTSQDASIIAYSAQYVDDATNSGIIHFDNGAMYSRISSAHKMFDYRNSDKLANHQVWIPFHFLPGNEGKPQGENPDGTFIRKLVCYPDSHISRDMLKSCANDIDKPYALHRLGITMHVYADTWAHQGFAGVNNKINEVNSLSSEDKELDENFFNKILNFFVSKAFPLGHGAALSYPDKPWLVWEYTNGLGDNVKRNNPDIFMEAANKMCQAMQCFHHSELNMNLESMPGLPKIDADKIFDLINSIKEDSGEDRHKKWIDEIKKGSFSFGPEEIHYIAKGKGSWKHESIGQLKSTDEDNETFTYDEKFISSNWKLFHDALQAHRFDILHDVLPKYGICSA